MMLQLQRNNAMAEPLETEILSPGDAKKIRRIYENKFPESRTGIFVVHELVQNVLQHGHKHFGKVKANTDVIETIQEVEDAAALKELQNLIAEAEGDVSACSSGSTCNGHGIGFEMILASGWLLHAFLRGKELHIVATKK